MVGNKFQLIQEYQQLRRDPRQYFAQRHNINIPDNVNISDSNDIIQFMLNNGYKTQEEYNNVQTVRNNPAIQKMFGMH